MMEAVCIIPVHRPDPEPLERTVDEAVKHCSSVVVVANCDQPVAQLQVAVDRDCVDFVDVGRCVGKAEAIRVGLRHAIEQRLAGAFVQLDATMKIPPSVVPALLTSLSEMEASMVVANRYAQRDLELEPHRFAVTSIFREIARSAGSDTPDPFCGSRAYTRALGLLALEHGISEGYGIEFEQLLIAAHVGGTVMNVSVPPVEQDSSTDGRKVIDTLDVIIARLPSSQGANFARSLKTAILRGTTYQNSDFEVDGTAIDFMARPAAFGPTTGIVFEITASQ